jgi:dCTP deaminase
MILVDRQIREMIQRGSLGENFDEGCIQPASYDLRIGANVYSSDSLDRAIDLSRNSGAHRIPPYGIAVLQTYETFTMPDNWVGRFGLKSSFARRGLFASTGPQVDPGFNGKLIVSLMNQTPRSHVIGFKEEFLSIEFHQLSETPQQTYHGPYQHRKDVGPEILSDLVRLEGLDLSQMQSQFTELVQHVKEWQSLAGRFDEFLRVMNDMIRRNEELQKMVVDLAAAKSMSIAEIAETRDISPEDAEKEVLALFHKHHSEQLYYSDIADELNLDFGTVINACKALEDQGLIQGGSSNGSD